jgi:hypothetical protein
LDVSGNGKGKARVLRAGTRLAPALDRVSD